MEPPARGPLSEACHGGEHAERAHLGAEFRMALLKHLIRMRHPAERQRLRQRREANKLMIGLDRDPCDIVPGEEREILDVAGGARERQDAFLEKADLRDEFTACRAEPRNDRSVQILKAHQRAVKSPAPSVPA